MYSVQKYKCMKNKRLLFLVLLFLLFLDISVNAQLPKLFNSNIQIDTYIDLGAGKMQILGSLNSTDISAENLLPGDLLFDQYKREYKILNITPGGSNGGSTFDVVTQYLGGGGGTPEPQTGTGIICRTTSNGFPLIADDLLTDAIQNASILAVDGILAKFNSGASLPALSGAAIGDYVFYSPDNAVYNLTSNGWIKISLIQDGYMSDPSTETYFPANGTVVNNLIDPLGYYVSTSTAWLSIPTVSVMPTIPPKFGDVFQVVGDKLYMFGATGAWEPISGASAVTPGTIFPTSPKIGDFYYDTTTNILYVYDATSTWKEVSVNGSTPNNSPAPIATKEGELYFDSTDKKLYVNNGIQWMPVDNSLPSGKVYIGNAAGEATPKDLSGDVTVVNTGVTTIQTNRITDAMLKKSLIPLSGFAVPVANVPMGGMKITGLGNPGASPGGDQDAATKNYVDTHTINLNTIPLVTGYLMRGVSSVAAGVAQNTIPISGFGAATASVDLGTNKIVNLADPAVATDAASKKYVDATSGVVPIGIAPPVSPLPGTIYYNLTDKRLYIFQGGLWKPADNYLTTDMMFVGDVNGIAVPTLKSNILLSSFGPPAADISMNGLSLTNMADPLPGLIGLQSAATRKYVDDKVATVATSSGTVFPATPADGSTFYNTATHTYYVYNGTDWIPLGNSLTNNQVYVGDAFNKAVSTPKANIPLSDWGAATSNISMGGTFNITNLADPRLTIAGLQDAATRKYVDGKTGNFTTGTTPPGGATLGMTYYNTTDKTLYVYDGTSWVPVNNILPTGQLYVGDGANKAAATAKSAVSLSGFGTPSADIAFGMFKITGLKDPTDDQEAATKKYVDVLVAGVNSSLSLASGNMFVGDATGKAISTAKSQITLSGFKEAEANISMGSGSNNYKIINVANPTGDQDAATKNYVDVRISDPTNITLASGKLFVGSATGKATETLKTAIPLSGFGAAAADVDLGTHKIMNLVDPAANQDAATKNYVDVSLASFSSIPALTLGYLFVGDATNKAVSTAKNTIPLSGFGAAAADIDLGSHKLVNLTDPSAVQDAATKNYVDGKTGTVSFGIAPPVMKKVGTVYYSTIEKTFYIWDGTSWLPEENVLPNGMMYVGGSDGFASQTLKSNIPLSGFGAAAADVDFGTHKLVNVTDPSGDQDAATKKYVDTQVTGVKFPQIGANTLLGNNTASTADPIALIPSQVVAMLSLNNVDNTSDVTKNVRSATKLTTAIKINGVDFDGSANITIPGDNMGNHTATQNIKTVTFAINSDGVNGKGLSFDTPGNAAFAQDVTVNGNFYTPSDQRLKTNIVTLGNALQAINSIRGVRFEYKDQKKYAKGPKIGVIAQELLKVFPEMVTKGTDGFFKVDYTQLSAVLIQAVKEQQKMMHQQQLEINELKVRLDKQQLQINAILKKID